MEARTSFYFDAGGWDQVGLRFLMENVNPRIFFEFFLRSPLWGWGCDESIIFFVFLKITALFSDRRMIAILAFLA